MQSRRPEGLNEKTYKTVQDLPLRNLTYQTSAQTACKTDCVNVVDVVVVVEVRRRRSKTCRPPSHKVYQP